MKAPNKLDAVNEIANHISSSLTGEILNIGMFANVITTEQKIRKGDQHIRYKLEQRKKISTFDILNHISKYM